MIIFSGISLFVSLFLEGIITSIFGFFSPNFLLITLLLIYPLFMKNKKLYLILLVISTTFYDLLYTNILFLNTVCIFCIYLLMEKNMSTVNLFYLIGYYFLYHFILFSCFYMVGAIKNPLVFLDILSTSIISNLLYTCIFYFFVCRFYPSHEKKETYLKYSSYH